MKIFLASFEPRQKGLVKNNLKLNNLNYLESFFYIKNKPNCIKEIINGNKQK